jgi:hypothetical protein
VRACPGAFINIGISNTDRPLHIPTSTTRHCRLEQVCLPEWWRRSYQDFQLPDIISQLHVEPKAGSFLANATDNVNARTRAPSAVNDVLRLVRLPVLA